MAEHLLSGGELGRRRRVLCPEVLSLDLLLQYITCIERNTWPFLAPFAIRTFSSLPSTFEKSEGKLFHIATGWLKRKFLFLRLTDVISNVISAVIPVLITVRDVCDISAQVSCDITVISIHTNTNRLNTSIGMLESSPSHRECSIESPGLEYLTPATS